jgi:hypothetical protein
MARTMTAQGTRVAESVVEAGATRTAKKSTAERGHEAKTSSWEGVSPDSVFFLRQILIYARRSSDRIHQ